MTSRAVAAAALTALFFAYALFAVLAPLACYALALAAFGLPHVLSELRYVDSRFGRRFERGLLLRIGMALAVTVACRVATVFHLVPSEIGVPAELAGVALLCLTCATGGTPWSRALGLAAGCAIGASTLVSPFGTIAVLAMLHNLTPLGFYWEIAPRGRRGRFMAAAVLPLLALPMLVATGLPRLALAAAGSGLFAADPLGAGALADNLAVYLPPSLESSSHAFDLFTAAVVAQGAHYFSVIVVLPWLLARLDPSARPLFSWPGGATFAVACLAVGGVSLAGFSASFADARALYGLVASLHAWIEIPLLVLIVTGSLQPAISRPARNEAELVRSETSMA